jgi:hypothetical protein
MYKNRSAPNRWMTVRAELQLAEQHRLVLPDVLGSKLIGSAMKVLTEVPRLRGRTTGWWYRRSCGGATPQA